MPTEMELTLEQTQQGVSYEVSIGADSKLTVHHSYLLSALRNSDYENMLSTMTLILMSMSHDPKVSELQFNHDEVLLPLSLAMTCEELGRDIVSNDRVRPANLLPIHMFDFDMILGMDWLLLIQLTIDCYA
ncbi:hypothetical protein Tco_0039534 [Tanacetum coccineum]|uniref:Uncharacterized protein n=1 Tax=Tanacetum coccineum TaxID=301880 RepID=A0ABQ4WC23_9ASTR